jgi:hypothetical protein
MDDPFFQEFLKKGNDTGVTAGIFVIVDGACITGMLARRTRFAKQTNEVIRELAEVLEVESVDPDKVRELQLEVPKTRAEDEADSFLTLQGAEVVSAAGKLILPIIRIDPSSVSAWGVLAAAPEDDEPT